MRRLGQFFVLRTRPAPSQVRALIGVGIVLRWVAITFAALAGYVVPRVPRYLTAEILAAIVYNGVVMAAEKRTADDALPRLALTTTFIDQIFCFAFIVLYNVTPSSHQVAAYFPPMIEAVGFFGAVGVALCSACFLAGVVIAQLVAVMASGTPFDASGAFSAIMIVVLIGACLGAANHVVTQPAAGAASARNGAALTPGSSPQLTDRDHELLRLLALGCSNAAIASQLGVSERSIKASIEKLLTRMKARNRAEAVATAARLEML